MKKLLLPLIFLASVLPAQAQRLNCDQASDAPVLSAEIETMPVKSPVSPGEMFASRTKSEQVTCIVAGLLARQASAQEDHKRVVQQFEESWNGTEWQSVYQVMAMYDANGFFSEFLFEFWNGTEWVIEERDSFVNDANGNVLETTIEVDFGAGLEPYERQSSTFDANGNQVTSFASMWDGSEWVYWFRSYLTYNENDQQTGFMNEIYVEGIEDWLYNFAGIFAYDGLGRLESLINQFWNDDRETWDDAFRTLHVYDTATRVSTFESWDEFMGVWSRSSRETSTYDTLGQEIEYISEYWNGTEWVVSVRITKTYGPDGIESETIEFWNGTEFVLQSRALTTYDGEGCLVEELEQMWDGSDWVDYYRYTYTYESTTTAVDDFFDVAPFSLDVYPNPFADVVNLTVVMDDFESVRVEVYDILGRKADTIYSGNLPVGKSELSWSAQGSAAGTYFVTVRTSDYTATTPIVVQ